MFYTYLSYWFHNINGKINKITTKNTVNLLDMKYFPGNILHILLEYLLTVYIAK